MMIMSIRRIWRSWLFLSQPKSTHGVHLCLSNSCCAPPRMSCARQREFLNQKRETKKEGGGGELRVGEKSFRICLLLRGSVVIQHFFRIHFFFREEEDIGKFIFVTYQTKPNKSTSHLAETRSPLLKNRTLIDFWNARKKTDIMTTDSLEVTSQSTNISSNICLASSVASNNCLAPSITSNSSSSAFHAVAPKNKSFSGQWEFYFQSKVI